jgi:hypothetical protein
MTMQLAQAGLNLFVAACLGAAIGLERQWRQRLAGLRTNTLVALGAAIFVTYSHVVPDGAGDTRIAAQVVSGIGLAGGEDRCSLSERQFRQGLSDRLEGWARPRSRRQGDQRSVLRNLRAHGGLTDRYLARLGRRCAPDRRDRQIRRPGDPQGVRPRLDPDALPSLPVAIGRRRHEAGGPREIEGRDLRQFRQGPTDARWKDDPGMKEWQAFCAKYLTQTDLIDANGSRRSTAKAGSCSARFWRLDRKLPPSGPFRVKVLDRELTVTRPAPDPSRMVRQDEFQIPTRAAATTPPATTCPE